MTDETDALVAERFWSKVERKGPEDCWPWKACRDGGGYGRFRFQGKDKAATHVALALTTGSLPPAGLFACHHCDNPGCVNPAHLFLGTLADNNADRDRKGRGRWKFIPAHRKPRGARHGSAKLTEGAVLAILECNQSHAKIASQYGVNKSTIQRIKARRIWGHV